MNVIELRLTVDFQHHKKTTEMVAETFFFFKQGRKDAESKILLKSSQKVTQFLGSKRIKARKKEKEAVFP